MTACPLCSSPDAGLFADLNGHRYRRCAACACVYHSNPEAALAPTGTYTVDYIRERGHDRLDSPLTDAKWTTAHHYFAILERYRAPGNLLEIGCSTGVALKAAAARGWQVRGVEINSAAVDIANRLLGQSVVQVAPLREDMFPDGFFDTVVMFDVIEHLAEPHSFMRILVPKIAPGGFLLLVTPNAASLSANLLRSRWPHLIAEHLILYSPKAIRNVLTQHGFEIVKRGWALKFLNTEIIRRHFACHPNSVGAQFVVSVTGRLRVLERVRLPVNVGEMYVVARRR